VTAYAVAWLLRWRVRRGRQAGQADPRAAALVVALVVGLQVVTTPFQLFVSRRAEAAADLAALDLTEDPQTYADLHLGLARANLADPDPPGWVYSLWYTHPTISARLELGRRWPFPEPGSGGPSAGTEQR
jgi:STE24 endopeptidase